MAIYQAQALAAEVRDIGESITSLSSSIEKNAHALAETKKTLRLKRESLKSIIDNYYGMDVITALLEESKIAHKKVVAKAKSTQQAVMIGIQIKELNEQKKELEESISNKLLSYHGLTNSRSFDTTGGDQCDFVMVAKIKPKQLDLFKV